jgi:hypothetical protein
MEEDTGIKHFAYIIDGEVAHVQSLFSTLITNYDKVVAVLSSNPTIVEVGANVSDGWLYDEATGSFTEPLEITE